MFVFSLQQHKSKILVIKYLELQMQLYVLELPTVSVTFRPVFLLTLYELSRLEMSPFTLIGRQTVQGFVRFTKTVENMHCFYIFTSVNSIQTKYHVKFKKPICFRQNKQKLYELNGNINEE